MKITLKKISFSASLSEETPCYSADVYADGRLIGYARNHGHGGCDTFYRAEGVSSDDLVRIEAEVKSSYPPIKGFSGEDIPTDLELACHTLVWEHADKKRARSWLRRAILLQCPGSTNLLEYKAKPTPERLTQASAKHPGFTVLNSLPFDEAFAILKDYLS